MSEEISKIREKLEKLEERILKLERLYQTKPEEIRPLALRERLEKFAEKVSLSIDQLEDVFEFNEQDLKFIYRPLTGSVADRQVSFTQCILIGLEEIYQKKSLATSELMKKLDDYGLDSNNLSRNLQRRPNIFRMTGRGKATKYKLTDIGKTSAIQLVQTLATPSTQS